MDGEPRPRRQPLGTEEPLLLRSAAGDAAAFRRLYDMRSARLYGLALRITGRPDLAADAVHDAMLRVWRAADRLGPQDRSQGRAAPERDDAEAWLLAWVRYRALDLARPDARRAGPERDGAGPPDATDPAADPLARLGGTRDGEALRRGLAGMAPVLRRLVLMAFVEGMTHSELAARTGQSPGTVKGALRRALAALRDRLDAPEGVPQRVPRQAPGQAAT